MPYYQYRQNNSGGYRMDPAAVVIGQADNEAHADLIAQDHGVDFHAPFCPCCGERWMNWDVQQDVFPVGAKYDPSENRLVEQGYPNQGKMFGGDVRYIMPVESFEGYNHSSLRYETTIVVTHSVAAKKYVVWLGDN